MKDAVKKVIAAITVGKDMNALFPDVVNCMRTGACGPPQRESSRSACAALAAPPLPSVVPSARPRTFLLQTTWRSRSWCTCT